MVYSKKNDSQYFTDRMEKQINGMALKDQDLFIDIRLGSEKEIYNLFEANMSNIVNEEFVFDKLTNPNQNNLGHDGREHISFETSKAPAVINFGKVGDISGKAHSHGFGGRHMDREKKGPNIVTSKADKVEEMPLFLSHEYQEIYDHSKETAKNWDKSAETAKTQTKEEKKKAKGAAKLYKSGWVQKKLAAQTERKKKQRGQKATASRTNLDGSTEAAKPPPPKRGKKSSLNKEEQQDLEEVVETLKTELEWKEEEFKEMRDELEALRAQNAKMIVVNKKEKQERQLLTANKQKYTMLKELVENTGQIQDQSFFENKRNENASTNGSLRNQMLEQQKENRK